MHIRQAAFEDMTVLSEIMVRSFRDAFSSFISRETMDAQTDPIHCLAMMESIYRQDNMHFLLADQIGMLVWRDGGSTAEIMALHILPQSRGSGLGHALLEESLRKIGSRPVFLWTFRENTRARRFYEKHGFRQEGGERISDFDGAPEICYVLYPQ